MSPLELRASIALASIFGLRMLGMFVILPVFAVYAEGLPGGQNLTLVGIALGAYGLTQAILQLPFGWWSDRFGRKPVIYCGLLVFALGSFVAAMATSVHMIIVGRVLQGAGAISAAVIAMTADLTREEHRTKAMAMIGSTIGLTFALSLIAGPWLDRLIGVPGIFALTGLLALAAIAVVRFVVPDTRSAPKPSRAAPAAMLGVLLDPQLARLNFGIFALHAVLMALFIAIPFSLRDAGLPVAQHWQVYLPVMLGSFVLMLPAVMGSAGAGRLRIWFIASVALLLVAHLLLPALSGEVWPLAVFLLLFFTPFNVLEAMLPSLTTRLAPEPLRGTAIGLYSSIQFFGTFVGAAAGGALYGRWGLHGIVIFGSSMLVIWLVLALGMRVPDRPAAATRSFALPVLDRSQADQLLAALSAMPGVREARVVAEERRAYLKVDSAGFDEQNVVRLIAGES